MIKVYETGEKLVAENRDYLNTNPYMSSFFFLDARFMKQTDQSTYAVMAQNEDGRLLAMKLAPFSLLLFGSEENAAELVEFLTENGYDTERLLGSEALCKKVGTVFAEKYGACYEEALAMDFMETTEITQPTDVFLEKPAREDLAEIVVLKRGFVQDCGLADEVRAEHELERLAQYRVLRMDGKIVSMAAISPVAEGALKITDVYVRPEYRGSGLARKTVNAVKNEILEQRMIATLNVDKKNPITNHLYESLGFRRVFSQGEFRRL